jgi:hypothetical protein
MVWYLQWPWMAERVGKWEEYRRKMVGVKREGWSGHGNGKGYGDMVRGASDGDQGSGSKWDEVWRDGEIGEQRKR